MSPDVDQRCVFPSRDGSVQYGVSEEVEKEEGYGQNWGCRRIEDWEETGINDTYRVTFYNFRLELMLAFSLSAQLKLMMREWR